MAFGKLQYAGEFEIELAVIVSRQEPGGLNIESSIMGITIFEDMSLPLITGEISMFSTVSFADQLPLIGEEKLELVLTTPTATRKINFEGDSAFLIYQCAMREHSGNLQVFTLKFCSPEAAINNSQTFSQSMQGTNSEIVSRIMSEQVKTKKAVLVEPTKDRQNIVFSNSHSFDAIKQVMTNSINGEKQPGYYFFENRDGFHFKSISKLTKNEPIWDYKINDEGAATIIGKGIPNINLEMHTVITHKMNHPDRLMDIKQGVLGSKLIAYDIFNKQYRTNEYDYVNNFAKEKHIESPKSSLVKFNPQLDNLSEFDTSRIYYEPVSIKGGGGKGENGLYTGKHKVPRSVEDIKLQQKDSQRLQMEESFNIDVTVHGNTEITVGELVDISIIRPTEEDQQSLDLDNFYQGLFLVKRIRHEFLRGKMEHVMYMTLVRDSVSARSSV